MTDDRISRLEAQVASLTHEVGILQDIHALRTLHFKYGYFMDKCLFDEVVDLFSENSRQYFANGVYKGKAGARRLYCDWLRAMFAGGRNQPVHGLLYDHMMLQDIVDVAPDRLTAKGRFRCFMAGGTHRSVKPVEGSPQQFWEGGVYENEYVKEAGVWKIAVFNYNMMWQADYTLGWSGSEAHIPPLTKAYPDDPKGPDELLAETPAAWPATRIVPFHYPHPVTGKEV